MRDYSGTSKKPPIKKNPKREFIFVREENTADWSFERQKTIQLIMCLKRAVYRCVALFFKRAIIQSILNIFI